MARYACSKIAQKIKDDHSKTEQISLSSFYSNFLKSNLNQPNINF